MNPSRRHSTLRAGELPPTPAASADTAPLDRRRLLATGAAALAVGLTGRRGVAAVPPAPPARQVSPPAAVPGFDDPTRWAGRSLRVGAWGGEVQQALRDAVWLPFGAATGCVVEEATTDYARLAVGAGTGSFVADLLLVDPVWAERAPASGLVQPLGLGAIAPAAVEAFGGGDASLPAYAYALVGAYGREAVGDDAPPRSWPEWWDTGRYPGARTLARDPFGTLEFALLADGVPPERLYPLDAVRAIEVLKRISGRIVDRWWDTGEEPVNWLGSGRVDLASSWHYRLVAGRRDGLAVETVWDSGLVVADRWVVPVGAREPEIALDLVRYASTPQVQAALATLVPLGPIAPAALTLLNPALAAELPTAPANLPRLLRPDTAWWATNRGEAVQLFNTWLLGTPGA